MSKLTTLLPVVQRLGSYLFLSLLILASAPAQTPVADRLDRGGRSTSALLPQYRFTLTPACFHLLPTPAAPATRTALPASLPLAPMAAGPNLPVVGSGTIGRLTKWTGFTSGNSFIGDSTIFESKEGFVGIGTDTPTSRLTVAGTIRALAGGFQFPDGTVQTTALASGDVVRSLNGVKGDVTLMPGANITITPTGNTLTIAASNTLTGVAHDTTLTGNGTAAAPLGVTIPLLLTGASPGAIVTVRNTTDLGDGLRATGGDGSGFGGDGVWGTGGNGGIRLGGSGVRAVGGNSDTAPGGRGVFARGGNSNSDNGGTGVEAEGGRGGGGQVGDGGIGVMARGGDGIGSDGGHGVVAQGGNRSGANTADGDGIVAIAGGSNALAGRFIGSVTATLSISAPVKNFKIDHPLDPENKYLYHTSVESPDMMNIYNGNVTTDTHGEAVVELPDYFEALNRDFRYQLTVIGAFAQAIIADEIRDNRFTIRTTAPNVKVSWQVTGVRQDAYARKSRSKVEEDKPEPERGTYLHPEAFNLPEERGVVFVRNPELMRQLKVRRQPEEEAKKPKQP